MSIDGGHDAGRGRVFAAAMKVWYARFEQVLRAKGGLVLVMQMMISILAET